MTWKQKKDLENRKVVSLGGKPQKKQRLPLSVARVMMKKQKEREEKMAQEPVERRRPEDRVLKSSEGNFRNGVLDVKHLLRSPAPRPQAEDNNSGRSHGKGKRKKGGKKGHGKKKSGGKKRR
ncbi:Unknown protein [Striga hermonthica]|uniref:Uncharacterized protein n=1 Tax=Striga hermonthica TaxID=68872 RepID=A0A9N7N684_STRHE|nr:Unknown protein [Striga hermonthica]